MVIRSSGHDGDGIIIFSGFKSLDKCIKGYHKNEYEYINIHERDASSLTRRIISDKWRVIRVIRVIQRELSIKEGLL